MNSQPPSVLGQQPMTMGGPPAHPYSGVQYPGPPEGSVATQPPGSWSSSVVLVSPAMPMQQMHGHPYMPPGSMPPMHSQNFMPHSTGMAPYQQQ